MDNELELIGKLGAVSLLCNGAGAVLKHAQFKWLPDNRIPIALGLAGGVAHYFIGGQTPYAAVMGVIAGFASTGMHQATKHTFQSDKKVVKPDESDELQE